MSQERTFVVSLWIFVPFVFQKYCLQLISTADTEGRSRMVRWLCASVVKGRHWQNPARGRVIEPNTRTAFSRPVPFLDAGP